MKAKIDPHYLKLREKALTEKPDDPGLSSDQVFGVVVDLDHEGGRLTHIIHKDGRVGFYNSYNEPNSAYPAWEDDYVKKAANDFVVLAQTYLNQATRTESTDFPAKDEILFYLLTSDGRAILSGPVLKVGRKGNALNPLYEALMNIVKEIGKAEESLKYSSGSPYILIETK